MSTPDPQALLAQADRELAMAHEAWRGGNAGRGRVCSRRAAGMAIAARLAAEPRPGYGANFMHHLNALADDAGEGEALREAAWRLAARPAPEGGWRRPLPAGLTPMHDAALILEWGRVPHPP